MTVEIAAMAILLRAGPHLLEQAFTASARRNTWKYFGKAVLLRGVAAALGLPRPAFVETLEIPTRADAPGGDLGWALAAVSYARRYDPILAAHLPPDITSIDIAEMNAIDDAWRLKYNPAYTELVPAAFRERFIAELHALGFAPYTEHDWHQVEALRRFSCASTEFDDNDILPEMCAD